MKNKLPILIGFFLFATLCAQIPPAGVPSRGAVSDYVLGPADLIEISVFGVENFHFTRRISASGFITLPYINKVYVPGLTIPELEEKLTSLLDGRFIRDPQVSVFVREYQSQSVVVLGAVNNPGLYEMPRPLKLLDVVALAGGLRSDRVSNYTTIYREGFSDNRNANGESSNAPESNGTPESNSGPASNGSFESNLDLNDDGNEMVQLGISSQQGHLIPTSDGVLKSNGLLKSDSLRRSGTAVASSTAAGYAIQNWRAPSQDKGKDQSGVERISLKALLEEQELSQNIPIQGGDVVYIPEKLPERFYVIGEVFSPGAYTLPEGDGLLLTRALSLAGGPLKTAKMGKGILVRYVQGGGRQEIAVNFSDILKGKKPDFPVTPDDVIFIPGSTAKSIGYGFLGIVPSVASVSVATKF